MAQKIINAEQMLTLPQDDFEHVCSQAEKDLVALQGGHIFLTGATSFFGSWLIECLLYADRVLHLGLKITVFSHDPDRFLRKMPHLKYFSQLRFFSVWEDVELLDDVSYIVHGGNLPNDGTSSWPLLHMESALHNLQKLLSWADRIRCSSLLLISSGGAYRTEGAGSQLDTSVPLKEQQDESADNLREALVYGTTKRFMELYCTAAGHNYGIRIPIARCFSFMGKYMPLHGGQALGDFIFQARAGQHIIIKGDGTPLRSYLYGADLVICLLAVLVRGRHGVPYNIGSDKPRSLFEVANEIAAVSPLPMQVVVCGKPVEGNAPHSYVPDVTRIRTELRVPVEQAPRKSFQEYIYNLLQDV